MTRTESIDLLDNLIGMVDDNHDSDYDTALKMAIKALEQEPAYCDRNICLKNEYNGIGCDECEVTKSQEPKTGHWMKHDTGHSIYYDCSLCGCLAPCTETADSFVWKLSNFCPNCGARMVPW